MRVASSEVTERLARGEKVDPAHYYFRTTPSYKVSGEPFAWLQRADFIARGTGNPDSLVIDFFQVL